jgi:hypothetical protein
MEVQQYTKQNLALALVDQYIARRKQLLGVLASLFNLHHLQRMSRSLNDDDDFLQVQQALLRRRGIE